MNNKLGSLNGITEEEGTKNDVSYCRSQKASVIHTETMILVFEKV